MPSQLVVGTKGEKGDQGELGPQGLTGLDGDSGFQGPPGNPGADGAPGPSGATGPMGAPGIPGEPGEDGPMGAQGNPGNDGAIGPAGPLGPTGPIGVPGVEGEQGDPGVVGPPGNVGADGAQGAQGAPGLDGLSVPGAPGEDGADGFQGPPGNQGTTGDPGAPGAQGIPGLDGVPGPRGEAGDDINPTPPVDISGPAYNRCIILPAGIAAAGAPLIYRAGVNITTPEVGAKEFDGAAYYGTIDATSGRAQQIASHIFRLTAGGSAIGPAIADVLGANSAFPTVLNGVYEIEWQINFTKTTAGTVVWTITNTQAYTNMAAHWRQSVITGIAATGAVGSAGLLSGTTAAFALPATGSLTTAVNHAAIIRCIAECGTAGNIRLRATSSAGTITPLRGSYMKARRLSGGNVGTFVA